MKTLIKAVKAPLNAIFISAVILLICSKNKGLALQTLFTGNFTSTYYFGSMLSYASLLMTAGCGSALAGKGGQLNLGGEGQIYAAGFAGCFILNTVHNLHPSFVFMLALLFSCTVSTLISLLSALFKELKGAEVLLTTYLISSATIPIVDGLITASKSNTNTNMLSLPYIDQKYHLLRILEPSPLTIFFFLAVLMCLFTWYILYKTDTGRKTLIWGVSENFAFYAGLSSAKNTCFTLAASGILHGLTGFAAVTGIYYTCHKGFYSGLGWNALSTALIAGFNPLYVIPSSLVLSWLVTSCEQISLIQSLGFDVSGIIQAIILLSIAARSVKK